MADPCREVPQGGGIGGQRRQAVLSERHRRRNVHTWWPEPHEMVGEDEDRVGVVERERCDERVTQLFLEPRDVRAVAVRRARRQGPPASDELEGGGTLDV